MNNYNVKALKYDKIILLFSLIMFIIFLAVYIYSDKAAMLLSSLTFLLISSVYLFIYKLYKDGKVHFSKMGEAKKKCKKIFII